MRSIDAIAQLVMIFGGIMWLIVGLFRQNTVGLALELAPMTRLFAFVVGLCALWQFYRFYAQYIDQRPVVRRVPPA